MALKMSDMDLLERSYAMYVLLAVEANPGLTMTDIMRMEKGKERTKYVRLSEMIDAGLIYRARSEYTAQGLFLTKEGERVVDSIKKIRLELMRLEKKRKAAGATNGASSEPPVDDGQQLDRNSP